MIDLVTPKEATGYLRVSTNALAAWRSPKRGPHFIKTAGLSSIRGKTLTSIWRRKRRKRNDMPEANKKTVNLLGEISRCLSRISAMTKVGKEISPSLSDEGRQGIPWFDF